MTIWQYADKIAPVPEAHRLSLGEGDTPVVRSRRIGPAAGLDHLYFKLETSNPTGSYKDRFAAVGVSDMIVRGVRRCVATSSGNTGSAVAAYCAAAGIACEIAIVETAPQGKLKQMLAYGASLYRVTGFGLDPRVTAHVFEALRVRGEQPDADLLISAFHYSPVGMSGVQTISYELAEQLDRIDHVFSPAGGGGLTLAVAHGFEKIGSQASIHCVQPEGNDTIAGPLRDGASRAREVSCTSDISGLQVPNVIDGDAVIAACRASGGTGHAVGDEHVWQTQARLARDEGMFCEPAGAVALTGALQSAKRGEISRDATVVCLVTGSAFKDPPSLDRMTADAPCPMIEPDELDARLNA